MFRFHRPFRTFCRNTAVLLAASVFLLFSASVFADEIMIDDSPDPEEPVEFSPEEPATDSFDSLNSSNLFIEDSGSSAELSDGISMEDLEEDEYEPETEWTPEDLDLDKADEQRIREHLEALLAIDDPTGSDEELTVAAYIGEKMKALGYTVQQQPFHEGFLNVNGVDAPGVNIIAERGADSEEMRTRDIFLVVTHYESKTAPEENDPYANDKSGTAVLLEAARILSEEETDTDLCFLFLSGQTDGGYGAQEFLNSLSDELRSRIRGVLSVDRVGYDTGMPNVLKTLTGESNAIASLVQKRGLRQEAELILDGGRPAPEYITETSDSFIDAETTQTEYAGSPEGESETEAEEEERIPSVWSFLADPYMEEEDADPVLNPHLNSIQSIFANAQFPAAEITQYNPESDLELYRKTEEYGLADTTADDLILALRQVQNDGISEAMDTFNEVEIIGLEDFTLGLPSGENASETETETEDEMPLPETDPQLLAQTADVVAETLALIMTTEYAWG